MYDSFLKEAIDKYSKQIDYLIGDINHLKGSMEDKEQITNFLKEEKDVEKNLQDRFKIIKIYNFT